ncbi:MAG: hypothetical protein JW729_03525, partial [Bacteroidales bacterium]|nr:hypothetical protein [Bacteroidales bacterium]
MRKSYFLTVIGLLLYLSTFPNHAGNYGDQPERTFILAENITAFKSSQGAISMSFGTESTFNPASTQDCAVAALDAAHFIVVYTDLGNSSKGTVRLATVNGNSISWGTEIIFNTGQTFDISVTTLDDSHFVIAYQDWSNSYKGTAIVGSVSGSSISFGSEYIFNAAWTSEISVTKLNSSSFVVAYLDGGNSNRGTAIYGYVSGNSISYGAEYIYNTTTTAENSIIAFDATHFAIAFRDTDNAAGASVYGTLSGSSISYSSKSAFNTGTTYYVSATKLNSDQFIVAYQDASNSSKATAIVGSISGGAITFGSEFIFNGTSTSYDISAITIDESRFLVTDRDNWWKGTARVGTVSSTDISWGTNYEYTSSNPNYNAAVMLDPTHFAAVYAISSGYGTGVVGLLVEEVITWDGSTNKAWNTASNWSGD